MRLVQRQLRATVLGKEYSGSIANPRQYAHTISDEIYMQQIALRGVARTKLAFTSDRDAERMTSVENRDIKEIYFADYDGANPRRVTVSKTLNVAPAWSPDGQALAYSTWRPAGQFGTFQDMIISYIYKGVRQTPANGSPDKQNYLPAWSPDGIEGRVHARARRQPGNLRHEQGRQRPAPADQQTRHRHVADVVARPATQIAWVSDRSGNPKVYIMNADGTGQRKLTNESWADRPTWSRAPFNEIAYAARTGAGFDIKIYSFSTGQTMNVTDGIGSNESPAFSPNGRHIAFVSTRNGKAQIFTIDRDGKNLRQITREGNNGYPNWSQ